MGDRSCGASMAGMSELPPEAADLYREPPAGFIAARDALAAELQRAGRDDDAGTVKELRKPTLPVWAVDQLAAREPKLVEQLLDAGGELRAAQQATLSSAEAAERLRTATAARREVVAKLTASAVAALGEIGAAGGTQADTIAAALESASIDTQAGERLRTGTLTSLPDAPGRVRRRLRAERRARSAGRHAEGRPRREAGRREAQAAPRVREEDGAEGPSAGRPARPRPGADARTPGHGRGRARGGGSEGAREPGGGEARREDLG